MISCQEAVHQLWEYLENNLEADDRENVDRHLALCRRCCGEAEFTDALRRLLRATAGPCVPPEVEGHLVALVDALEQEVP